MIKKIKRIDWIIFLILSVLIIFFRCFVLKKFAFEYTDNDQVLMWHGLKDYSNGIFHETRFYGQAYNSMMEAFFAVPLYKLGITPHKALPIVTSILVLVPFFVFSLFIFLKKSPYLAFLILSIPLLLPVEYSLITSMPRGFITGIFIASFVCLTLFYVKSKKAFFFSAFLAVLAYSLNSNSVLLSIPCLALLFLENYQEKIYYYYSILGLVLGLCIHFALNYFYILHPNYNLHRFELDFSFEKIVSSFTYLGKYFNDVSPTLLFFKSGNIILFVFLIIAALLFREKSYKKALIVALMPLLILATLGINKIHDGSDSVFYSFSRMYLAIPLMLALSLSFFEQISKSKFFYLILIIPFTTFIYSFSNLNDKIDQNLIEQKGQMVKIMSSNSVLLECEKLSTLCEKYKVELVLIANHWHYDFFNYGCPSCINKFPNTLKPGYERRTWRLLEDEQRIYKRILIADVSRDFESEYDFVKKTSTEWFYIIENNKMYTIDLLDSLKIDYREFKN